MFLLDIRYDPENSTITKWIKGDKGCKPVREVYYPRYTQEANPNSYQW
jgi:hypothetical protein